MDENEYNSRFSRNNPDIMGQGQFDTKDSKVDYIAFLTADRNNLCDRKRAFVQSAIRQNDPCCPAKGRYIPVDAD